MQIFVTAPRLLLSISSEGERLSRSQMETSSHPRSVGPQAKSLEFVPYCLKAEMREESARKREGKKRRCQSPRKMSTNTNCARVDVHLWSSHLSRDGKILKEAVFHGEAGIAILQGLEQ